MIGPNMQTVLTVATGVLVSGCVSEVGYRSNTSLKSVDQAFFQCRVAAAQNVPPNTVIRSTPGFAGPIYGGCAGGYCGTFGPYYGTEITSYDANRPLRREYFRRCVASKGYTTFELPRCTAAQLPPDFKPSLRDRVTRPGKNACYVPVTKFASQIVNP